MRAKEGMAVLINNILSAVITICYAYAAWRLALWRVQLHVDCAETRHHSILCAAKRHISVLGSSMALAFALSFGSAGLIWLLRKAHASWVFPDAWYALFYATTKLLWAALLLSYLACLALRVFMQSRKR